MGGYKSQSGQMERRLTQMLTCALDVRLIADSFELANRSIDKNICYEVVANWRATRSYTAGGDNFSIPTGELRNRAFGGVENSSRQTSALVKAYAPIQHGGLLVVPTHAVRNVVPVPTSDIILQQDTFSLIPFRNM
ncbi:hypothetical protein TSMEX_008339 [Taenia solium]|eukprot:TsM_000195600 transcript=TsM_000195600 gene=TsM_000195600